MINNVIAIDKKIGTKRKKRKEDLAELKRERIEALVNNATVKFTPENSGTSRNRLESCMKILMNTIPIAEGLYRDNPSQGTAYSLSNLLQELQSIDDKLENKVDWQETSQTVINVILPIIESITLELGRTIRKEIKRTEISKKDKKKLQGYFDVIYKKYAHIVETKMESLNVKISELFKTF